MKITPQKNGYVIVTCEPKDIREFNAREHTKLPEHEDFGGISFGFLNLSGELLRVVPNSVRAGGSSWERLMHFARIAWRAE